MGKTTNLRSKKSTTQSRVEHVAENWFGPGPLRCNFCRHKAEFKSGTARFAVAPCQRYLGESVKTFQRAAQPDKVSKSWLNCLGKFLLRADKG